MKDNLFKLFIKHRAFLKKAGITMEYVEGDHSPYLYVSDPVVIASFTGFVKKHFANKNIYFRGEPGNFQHVIPSLFRYGGVPIADTKEIQQRYRAYQQLTKAAFALFSKTVSRFKNEDIDVLFQHYGIKSPVIDLVDNIFVAIWFAMDTNTSEHGFIRIMNTSRPGVKALDLRKEHSSLSLRLHTQHGLIMKKDVSRWNKNNILFDEYEIARIKFPLSIQAVDGALFSRASIYPSATLDNTLKIMKTDNQLDDEIERIEKLHSLSKGTLGKVQ